MAWGRLLVSILPMPPCEWVFLASKVCCTDIVPLFLSQRNGMLSMDTSTYSFIEAGYLDNRSVADLLEWLNKCVFSSAWSLTYSTILRQVFGRRDGHDGTDTSKDAEDEDEDEDEIVIHPCIDFSCGLQGSRWRDPGFLLLYNLFLLCCFYPTSSLLRRYRYLVSNEIYMYGFITFYKLARTENSIASNRLVHESGCLVSPTDLCAALCCLVSFLSLARCYEGASFQLKEPAFLLTDGGHVPVRGPFLC